MPTNLDNYICFIFQESVHHPELRIQFEAVEDIKSSISSFSPLPEVVKTQNVNSNFESNKQQRPFENIRTKLALGCSSELEILRIRIK